MAGPAAFKALENRLMAAATGSLCVDPDDGLPLERRQVVRFDAGDMRVVERYTEFRLARP